MAGLVREQEGLSAAQEGLGRLAADDVHLSHSRVLFQGVAEILEGPVAPSRSPRLHALVAKMAARYIGPEGPEYAARTADLEWVDSYPLAEGAGIFTDLMHGRTDVVKALLWPGER